MSTAECCSQGVALCYVDEQHAHHAGTMPTIPSPVPLASRKGEFSKGLYIRALL